MIELPNKPTFTFPEISTILSCSRQHVYNLVDRGDLQAIRIGRRGRRITRESLRDFLTRNTLDPSA
jgi:excisionase family DNA binding protein